MSQPVIHRTFNISSATRLRRVFNIVEQFTHDLNQYQLSPNNSAWANFILMNVGHSSSEPIYHLTVRSSDAIMRQNNQSVVHHIYYDPAEDGTEGTYRNFSVHHEQVTQDPSVAIQAVNNENRRWRHTLFSGGNSNEAAVGYSRILDAYYIIDGTGMRCQVTLTKDATTNNYYFTHPESQQSKWAHFPVGVPTPTSY